MPKKADLNETVKRFSSIKDVNLDDPTITRLFYYAVEDGEIGEEFFSIDNIDISNSRDFEHWLNVCDKGGQLLSTFVSFPTRDVNGRAFIPFPLKFGDGAKVPVLDNRGKVIWRPEEEWSTGRDGYPVRIAETTDVRSIPLPAYAPVSDVMAVDVKDDSRITPVRNSSNAESVRWTGSMSKQDTWKTAKVEHRKDNLSTGITKNSLNPARNFQIKQEIRARLNSDSKVGGMGGRYGEIIQIKIREAQMEIRDEEGNIVQHASGALYLPLAVRYNFRNNRLEMTPAEYERMAASAISHGQSRDWTTANRDTMNISKNLDVLVNSNDPIAQDIIKRVSEELEKATKTGNRSKINLGQEDAEGSSEE